MFLGITMRFGSFAAGVGLDALALVAGLYYVSSLRYRYSGFIS
jgi:hypothetical protein